MTKNLEINDIKRDLFLIYRKRTNLGPLDKARLATVKWVEKHQGDDHSKSELLEYQLREKKYAKDNERAWKEYLKVENDGTGLQEFHESQLEQDRREIIDPIEEHMSEIDKLLEERNIETTKVENPFTSKK